MSSHPARLLPPSSIPSHYWDPAPTTEQAVEDRGMLTLPAILTTAYNRIIDRLNLRSVAAARRSDNPPRGGLTLEATNEHFAQQFDGSAARAQLTLLDPLNRFESTANMLIRKLAGNVILVSDTPCGAGAATWALLSTIAELRAASLLPREPLDVRIIAAELSEHARNQVLWMFEEMAPRLAEQAINVQIETLPWDVTDALSNTALVRRLNVVRDRCKKHLLIVANFNGFLVSESKQQRAKQQLSELFRYCGGEENHAIWIEPNMNTVVRRGGLYGWLERNVVSLFVRLPSVEGHSEEPVPAYNTYFRQALNPEQAARVSLAILSLDLSLPPR